MDVLRAVVKHLKHELEDPSRMDDEIISACLVLFDEKESFFRNHKIDIPKKEDEPETDHKPVDEEKSKDQDEEMGNQQEGGNEAFFHIDKHDYQDKDEVNSNHAEADDEGNKADTEGWGAEDDPNEREKPYRIIENEKEDQSMFFQDEENADVGGTNTFETNTDFCYGFDEELQCMIYTGDTLTVGDWCDAMKIEPKIKETIQCWEQAQIIDEDERNYYLKFNRDSIEYNRVISKEHYRTMMFKIGTHTRKNSWRYQSSDKLLGKWVEYYCETIEGWCEAKIMATMNNLDNTEDQVLLELKKPLQGKEHLESIIRDTYPQLSIRSPLIREHHSWANTTQHEELELQEMNQTYPAPIGPQLPSSNNTNVGKDKNKRSIQIKITEYFFEIDGHKSIIERLNDKEHPVKISTLIHLLTISGHVGEY